MLPAALVAFELADLLDTPLVPACLKACIEPRLYNLFNLIIGREPRSDRQDIGIVVLAGKPGDLFIPRDGRTNAFEADTSRKRRAEVIDQVAAGYILQGALDRLRYLAR